MILLGPDAALIHISCGFEPRNESPHPLRVSAHWVCRWRMKAIAAPSRLFLTIALWSTCWILSKVR